MKFIRKWINSIFLLSAGMFKLYFKNIVEINFIKCVKVDILGTSVERHNSDSPRDIFCTSLRRLLKTFMQIYKLFFMQKSKQKKCSLIINYKSKKIIFFFLVNTKNLFLIFLIKENANSMKLRIS